jgi:hypothetical protein
MKPTDNYPHKMPPHHPYSHQSPPVQPLPTYGLRPIRALN